MRLYWRVHAHTPLFLRLWQPGGYRMRCVFCGRPGIELPR